MPRVLHQNEINLLKVLLEDKHQDLDDLANYRVEVMKDGGMGSVRFISDTESTFGQTIAEAEYIDEDGIKVSIALNIDKQGDLFELDFWKTDFSPLKRYPEPSQIVRKT